MADQGQPLMTVPQTNLFGAAADDISSILANREVQKRKQMLEDIKTQLEIQKANNETATTQSALQTASQNRDIAAKRAPMDLDKLGAEITDAADKHAASLSTQETHQRLLTAMDAFDAAQKARDPEAMTREGAKVVGYGGHLPSTDEMNAMNVPQNQARIQDLLLKYAQEKDPTTRQAIGMQIANIPGGHYVQPNAATVNQFGAFGSGGIMNKQTGEVVRQPFAPGQKAPIDPQVVEGALNSIRASGTPTGIPPAVYQAAIQLATQRGETIIPLTAASRNMREIASAVGSKFDDLIASAQRIKDMGLFGSINGRLRDFAGHESAGIQLEGLTPEESKALGDFTTRAGLFTSGAMLAHFRSRGGEAAYNIMKPLLSPEGKDFDTYLGNILAAKEVLDGYAHQGGVQPTVGAGTGGGPGVAPDATGGLGAPPPKKAGGGTPDPGGIR